MELTSIIVTATDSCTSVAEQFKITEAEFYAMVCKRIIRNKCSRSNKFFNVSQNPGLHHSEAHVSQSQYTIQSLYLFFLFILAL